MSQSVQRMAKSGGFYAMAQSVSSARVRNPCARCSASSDGGAGRSQSSDYCPEPEIEVRRAIINPTRVRSTTSSMLSGILHAVDTAPSLVGRGSRPRFEDASAFCSQSRISMKSVSFKYPIPTPHHSPAGIQPDVEGTSVSLQGVLMQAMI